MDFVEVDIEIEDFNTSDLIDELESRAYLCIKAGGDAAHKDTIAQGHTATLMREPERMAA